jgi:hypothetical protein
MSNPLESSSILQSVFFKLKTKEDALNLDKSCKSQPGTPITQRAKK